MHLALDDRGFLWQVFGALARTIWIIYVSIWVFSMLAIPDHPATWG